MEDDSPGTASTAANIEFTRFLIEPVEAIENIREHADLLETKALHDKHLNRTGFAGGSTS